MKKIVSFFILVIVSSFSTSLFAAPSVDFSLDPIVSNLFQYDGIFYTKTGALNLAGAVSPNVMMIEFSGATSLGESVYYTGTDLMSINTYFSLPTSLTGGVYDISAFDGSGGLLGSERLVIDKTLPKAQGMTYFDDNHNGKIDRLVITMDENITGTVPLPYSGGLTLSTRKNGLFSYTISSVESSDYIQSVSVSGHEMTVGLIEGDMIKNNLTINASPGSSASDLKFGIYTNANITDFAGNILSLALSKFPNSSTGITNGTHPATTLDTGYLYGSYFSGALDVDTVDSRSKSGPLVLSGMVLTVSNDSYLGEGNILRIASGSTINGNIILTLGSGATVDDGNGNILSSNIGYDPYFETLTGVLIASGTTLTESGIMLSHGGLIGSGLSLQVSYETSTGSELVYSGSLIDMNTLIPLDHVFASGSFRVQIWREGSMGDTLLPGVRILLDNRLVAQINIEEKPVEKLSPDVYFVFQQWSFVTSDDTSLSEFSCDTTHADCKVNFDLSSSFTESFPSSDFVCELDFGLGTLTGEEAKCNPATVIFPRGGEYSVRFRITKKTDVNIFSERIFLVRAPHLPSLGGGSSSSPPPDPVVIEPVLVVSDPVSEVPIVSSVSIADPVIIIQSGIDTTNHCKNTADCTVNLEYKVLGPKEACHWDFSGGSYLSGTENKCNPGYVHYPIGDFTITLRVYEQGNVSNFREKILSFTSGTVKEIAVEKVAPTPHPPVAAIKLQGTLGKTKKQSGNSVTCVGVDECSINLSGEESYDLNRDKLTYYWDFGNGETSDRENPLAVKFTTGEYRVTFRVTDSTGLSSEATFVVTVTGKSVKEVVQPKPVDPNVFSLRITGVSPNPLGNDGVSEWAEITNPLGVDVSLASCILDDDPEKGSNPYHFSDESIIRANSKKRYYKLQTLINFNNTGDSANLLCGGQIVSSLSWDYSVPEGFIVSGKAGPYSEKVQVKVLRVVDGDTIVVELYGKDEKVRLIGVDTPETVHPIKKLEFFGKEASNYTKKMLEGKEVELEFDYNPRDKYDRLLAYVWIDSVNYNKEMIRSGYARAYLRFPFRYFKEFEKTGREAEKNKMGMWADKEVKKLLDAEFKEDKKALEEQLKEEDVAILDDLIEVAEDPDIASDKLDAEFLDRLLDVEDDDPGSKKKYTSLRKVFEKIPLQSIEIELQGLTSSKNRHLAGNVFICRTKKTCSVNFTAGKTRKDTIYFWDFGNDETFYGANPKSLKFGIGTHKISLRVLDVITGDIHDSYFTVIVHRLVTVKKPKKPKVAKVKTEKPLSVRLNDFFIGPSVLSPSLSTEDVAKSSTALAFVFFSGVHIILRRKKIVL